MSNTAKPLQDLLDMPMEELVGTPQASATSSTPLPSVWIERIFARLHHDYGSRFAHMWGDCDPQVLKAQWAQALGVLSRAQIIAGLEACRARDWPPSLPEFLRLCRGDGGYEMAWLDAVEQMQRRTQGQDVWAEVACYWAASRLGSDLLCLSYGQIQQRWKAALDQARAQVQAGQLPEQVPPRCPVLPAPGKGITPRTQARAHLAALRTRFGY